MVQPKGYENFDYKKLVYKKPYMGWSKQVPCLFVVGMEWEDWWFIKYKGFRQCKLNTISYVQMEQDQPIVYTMLYVNDLLTFCKNVDEIKEVKTIFFKKFDMKNLRELDFCLSIQMIRNWTKRMISLGQVKYISF